MAKVLLIADDASSGNLVRFVLQQEGLEVVTLPSPVAALEALQAERPALVVLDGAVKDAATLAFCRELRGRREWDRMPLVLLAEATDRLERLQAFTAGVDAVVGKPFDSLELVLNVKALLRLTAALPTGASQALQVGDTLLEPEKYRAVVERKELQLTRMETAILRILMERPGQVYSADALSQSLDAEVGNSRSVDAIHAHVRNLRAKIEREPKQPRRLVTVGRKGYSFRA